MHCECSRGLTAEEGCRFPKLEAYGTKLQGNNHGISNSDFFPPSSFSLGGIILTMWIHWGLQTNWQSVLFSSTPREDLHKTAGAKSQMQKVIQGQIPLLCKLPSATPKGFSIHPAPGGSYTRSAALHNLQAPLGAKLVPVTAPWDPPPWASYCKQLYSGWPLLFLYFFNIFNSLYSPIGDESQAGPRVCGHSWDNSPKSHRASTQLCETSGDPSRILQNQTAKEEWFTPGRLYPNSHWDKEVWKKEGGYAAQGLESC